MKILRWDSFIDEIKAHNESSYSTEGDLSPDKKVTLEKAKALMLQARTIINGKFGFFSAILIRLKMAPTWEVETMATDGVHILWNPDFTLKLTRPEVIFVLCHEILHNTMNHFSRMKPNHKLWNVAADYAINPLLLVNKEDHGEQGGPLHKYGDIIKMPKGGLYNPKYFGWSAEQIYDDLEKNGPPPKNKSEGDEKGEGEISNGEGGIAKDGNFGDVEKGSSLKDKYNRATGNSSGEEKKDGKGADKEGANKGQGGGGNGDIPTKSSELDDLSPEELAERWSNIAIQEASKSFGHGSGITSSLRKQMLDIKKTKINWKKHLEKFVNQASVSTRKVYPNRRIRGKDYVLSRKVKEVDAFDNLVIIIDTSGSISDNMIKKFLSETIQILMMKKPTKTHVLYFDDKLYPVDSFKKGAQPDLDKIKGGGGTNFHLPMKWVEENLVRKNKIPGCVIFFTDGYAPWPSKPKYVDKLIWVIIDDPDKRIHTPYGKRIDLDTKDDLK